LKSYLVRLSTAFVVVLVVLITYRQLTRGSRTAAGDDAVEMENAS